MPNISSSPQRELGGGDGGLGLCQGVGPTTLTLALTHLSSQLMEAWQPCPPTPARSHLQHLMPRSRHQPPQRTVLLTTE